MNATPAHHPTRRPLVLNVEGREGPRYVKSRILNRADFAVLEASDGQAALSLVRQHAPDLVLLSGHLSDIDGLDVCRLIKSDPQTARTMVLLTAPGVTDSHRRVQALDGGADSFLVEPVEPEELVSNINALLRMRGAEDAFRRTSQALHENEDLFRQLAEALADVVWIIDPAANRFLFVSPSFEALWGRSADSVKHDPTCWLQWVTPDDRTRLEVEWESMLRDGRLDSEFQLERPNGEIREVHMRAFPVRGADGRCLRVAGICQDVTRHNRAERTIHNEERRKDEFLAMLAHELRNPLAPMRSAVDLLQQFSPSREDMFRARDIISRQLHHLTRLVDELLDVSRFNQGKITLRRDLVELRGALNTAVETVRPLLETRRHTLRLSLPEQPLPVRGDMVRLTQIFANLLHNAAKFTPEGGQIAVEATAADGKVLVRVRDNGNGLSPDMQRQLFDPLAPGAGGGGDAAHGAGEHDDRPSAQPAQQAQQTQPAPQAPYDSDQPAITDPDAFAAREGAGIGLTLVQKLVTLHGGRISAESPGRNLGSTFIVELPVEPWQTWHPTSGKTRVSSTATHTIMLVDDNVDALEAMTMTLETLGHTVVTAPDGQSAIDCAASVRPDVVLLDLGMPTMDGFETARRLREIPELRNARLVALTGFGQPDDKRRTRAAGFDLHLVKPADLNALTRLLEELDA
ncbi:MULTISPECIES: response regulator [unclassified Cupriavidus]|uniref:hybrid sensor histidine kinase/response regulator n=1 Tax=unclassified Cupriavidus TaxID=2640874 RepID=UPI001C00699C|nr:MULTISPECIES: response regulator [unclassified Cupriavidus]MCA3184038.1 response regulator [Cupriavidus sp.]MCA3188885.1 response regulator [Cupriavidus sp.]MCA3198605.1 response regulator [Cupriavidus sp.]MCA3201351.1 response regulator [Cupriavidus sp.]MCA3210323.1 response regulator [Cupriavidus sp.]